MKKKNPEEALQAQSHEESKENCALPGASPIISKNPQLKNLVKPSSKPKISIGSRGEEVKKIALGYNFYFTVFSRLKQGIHPSKIAEQLGMSKQNINYYISSLKREGYIKKIGYGVWEIVKELEVKEVKITSKAGSKVFTSFHDFASRKPMPLFRMEPNKIRGHAFTFTIKVKSLRHWNKKTEILEKLKIPYIMVGIGKNTPRIEFRGHKIWLCNESIVIYYPDYRQYFTETAQEARKYAIYDLQQLLMGLEGLLGVNIKIGNKYVFKVSRQHYSLVKNALAHQYDKEGKKLYVYASDERLCFVIDNSLQLHEFEALHPERAVEGANKVQTYFKEVEELEGYTPKFVVNTIGSLAANFEYHSENLRSHVEAVKNLSKGVNALVKQVKKLGRKN
jgi:DNA-binding Lrp family transcriptional regulator